MQTFNYVAMDNSGGQVQGSIQADSQSQAISQIRANGLYPTKVTPMGGGGQAAANSSAKSSGGALQKEITLPAFLQSRIKTKELMVLTRQLSTLVQAGLPLLRGLRILLKQAKKPAVRNTLSSMGESIENGSTFSEALANHPKVFDKLFINMVRAGEAGGVLDVVLQRLAEFMEKAQAIRNKIKSAMTYPIVVLTAAVGILIFLMIFVIPKFQDIFEGMAQGKLPALTEFVIGVSNLVKNNGLVVLAVIIALVVLGKIFKKTAFGAYLLDDLKLRAPLVGTLFRRTAVARTTRTLGTLMGSGVPALQALTIVKDTSGNEVVARAISRVFEAVKEGESMAAPLEESKVFPGMVVSMVDVGEETGALPEMLIRIADTYDDEVDNAVEGLTSMIEPLMIIIMAVMIGTIVIAMFMPLISIIGTLGQ